MKIKKYIVRDMQEALKLIRDDLGPEAVIISSYRLPRRGWKDFFAPRQLEVTAALDDAGKPVPVKTPGYLPGGDSTVRRLLELLRGFDMSGENTLSKQPYPLQGYAGKGGRQAQAYKEGSSSPFSLVLREEDHWLAEKDLIVKWKKILLEQEIQETITENLLRGLSEAPGTGDSDEIIKATIKDGMTRLLEPAYRKNCHKKIHTFVGPTGVGKTVTMAKLAVHFSVYEKRSVALVSVNGNKAGSLEELRHYGGLIRVPVDHAPTPADLNGILKKHEDKDMIFIDTAGIPPRSTGQLLRLKSLLESVEGELETFLVLSSTTKSRDLLRYASDFRKLAYSRLIFTKLDETETCGSILNVVCKLGTPVAYVTFGQGVPDDIAAVNPKKLAGLLIGGVDRYVEQGNQDLF